ncbi:MAG: replicative DNA helicase [Beijerinckiaceae bacterium]|nr:replicative DNA helicase [Beijerinckiaceae bacterium]
MGALVKMNGTPLEQRPLPHDIDAEQGLLGAILLDNSVYTRIATLLDPDDFYDRIHAEIFDLVQTFIGGGRLASPITMKNVVGEMDFGDGMTGQQYLARLAGAAFPASTVVDYAKFIRDTAIQRRLYVLSESMMQRVLAFKPTDTASAMLDEMETAMAEIRPRGAAGAGQFQSFEAAALEAMEIANAAYGNGGVLSGLSTGLDGLDEALGGLQRSDLLIIAGRPGSGKTSLATNIAFNVAKDLREKRIDGQKTGVVAFFSLEMSRAQLAARVLSEHCRVSGWRIRKGKVSQPEIESFVNAGRDLGSLPIQIDQTGEIPVASLAMRARALKKKLGIELIVVDYLQLVKASARGRNDNRVQEVTEITGALKGLAKELDVPVIALSQLSRKVEERDDKRPMLSDLRESGSIEQDADAVIFVYRDEYYLQKREPPTGSERHNEWKLLMDDAHGRAELIIGKNRHGPETTVHVGFDSNLTKFHNDTPEKRSPGEVAKEKRERPKKLTLIKEATEAFGILKNLVITASIANDGHVDAAGKGTKLVSYTLWREKCAEALLDPGRDEKAAVSLMEKVVKDLRAPSSGHAALIGRGGSKSDPFVWLTDAKT